MGSVCGSFAAEVIERGAERYSPYSARLRCCRRRRRDSKTTARKGRRLDRLGGRQSIDRAAVTAFTEALAHAGWIDGRNLRVDYRYAAGDPARFAAYAAELVALSPDALPASLTPGLAALREQTRKIPIVFVLVADPVGQGFVQSLAKPGGNITGFSSLDSALFGKWLQLLKEVAPGLTRVTVFADPATSPAAMYNAGIAPAAASLGIEATFVEVHDLAAVETAMAAQARLPGAG